MSITLLTGNRLGWTVRCVRPPLLLPSCRKLEFRLSALMDSDLAWVNGKSGRKSWRCADAFQRSIISEAIYHFYLFSSSDCDAGCQGMVASVWDARCVLCNLRWHSRRVGVYVRPSQTTQNTETLWSVLSALRCQIHYRASRSGVGGGWDARENRISVRSGSILIVLIHSTCECMFHATLHLIWVRWSLADAAPFSCVTV